jgi:carbonic anhydrase
MTKLTEFQKGHDDFRKVQFKQNEERFKRLVREGQSPKALFIGCSDSRVVPNLITGTGAGDLFITRNIGNFVPPFKPDSDYHATAAAIEYAVSELGISDIIVCGHSDCGAVKALYKTHHETPENIHTIKWLELGQDAKSAALSALPNGSQDEHLDYTEKISVVFQLENLLSYPAVRKGVEKGNIFLHGWHYVIEDGSIHYYDNETFEFKPLGEKE